LIGMNLKRPLRTHAPRLELLDALMDSYLRWRDASRAVTDSYRTWRAARGPGREVAFDEYLAALDREERAAGGYRRAVEQTQAA
jgi:hypothetical protein